MENTDKAEKNFILIKNLEMFEFPKFRQFFVRFSRPVPVHNWYSKSIEWLLLPSAFTKIYKDAAKNSQVQN